MTATEEENAKREARQAEIRSAWEDLVHNKSFNTVFIYDLQSHFPIFQPCFTGDCNSHKAAQKDGEKNVVSHIWKAIEAARKRITSEPKEKPTSTIL